MGQEAIIFEIKQLLNRQSEDLTKQFTEQLDLRFAEQNEKIEERFRQQDLRFENIENHLVSIDNLINNIDERVEQVEARIKSVELTLENEITVNIMRIAEGHLDLDRKLNEALRVEEKKELFSLKLTSIENDVRKLMEKIG